VAVAPAPPLPTAPKPPVLELISESHLEEAPESVGRNTPSAALGGFVVPGSPPPLPPPGLRALPLALVPPDELPTLPPPEPGAASSTRGAPQFAAAIDVPISIAPDAIDEAIPTAPAVSRGDSYDAEPPLPAASRRRKAIVLGAVAGLGVLIFSLAALRAVSKPHEQPSATTVAHAATVAPTPTPAPSPVVSAAPRATTAPAPAPSPAPAAAPAETPGDTTPSRSSTLATGRSAPSPAARPAAPPSKPAAAASRAHPKPKPKSSSSFDPNSL
jgi:hypothetical protein